MSRRILLILRYPPVPTTREAYGSRRWRSAYPTPSFQQRRKEPITGQTQPGRSEKSSPPIIEASSTTQTPWFGERCLPGSRRTEATGLSVL
jgi:hypothetical protein